MSVSWSFGDGRPCPRCALRKFRGYTYREDASVDMDISMDINVKICGYGYGYGWEIPYPRQAWQRHLANDRKTRSIEPRACVIALTYTERELSVG